MMTFLRQLVPAAKWLWIGLLSAGIIWYTRQNFSDIINELHKIALWRLGISIGLLCVGRLLIVILAQDAVKHTGHHLAYTDLFYIIGLSELAKYLPGGIWHFVGRVGYYQTAGFPMADASRALFIEHIWLIMSAALSGGALLLWYDATSSSRTLSVLLIIVWVSLIGFLHYRLRNESHPRQILRSFTLQVMIWASLSASYAILLPQLQTSSWVLVLGAFVIGWLIGFLAVIAPGGLGAREIALMTLLVPLYTPAVTLILASVHRLLWIMVEILFGMGALLLNRDKRRTGLLE